ncbi:putative transmembrane protein [Toxoplasma gondii GAB2-2007-GAL-DOM2]|uniref:Putative transmembrane protein n=4 Tax=Toxoplasma gondii TaxID=5811 RepID=A0A086L1U3_TOXGO|nr:putative transmembrane protein [Toxoplasma gondii p89]KFG47298.1 putative transmembrane protein [Toxoplasma gondii GAB2-2007-GAL-DOM2]KFG50611.1 putative transmembrane protein [Toxoplasma gondii FOU]PUA88645.1 putative transmembrane protein [Toxoplasma gondii TgCATBr9]
MEGDFSAASMATNIRLDSLPPQRSVSLYWVEKWLLALDAVQVWCLLWLIVLPQFPPSWNQKTFPLLAFNLDFFHLLLNRLDTSNILVSSDAGSTATSRLVLACILTLVVAAVATLLWGGSRWIRFSKSPKEKRQEARELAEELQRKQRQSSGRMSLSVVFALQSDEQTKNQDSNWLKLCVFFADLWHELCLWLVQGRIILVTWIFAPYLNSVLPIVFCQDQAEICGDQGLFMGRIAIGVFAFLFAATAVYYVGSQVNAHLVAQTDENHEDYVQQKELEYMLNLNDSWRVQMLWTFTSFRREWGRVYHRQALMIVKLLLCLLVALFGNQTYKPSAGAAWLFQQVFPSSLTNASTFSDASGEVDSSAAVITTGTPSWRADPLAEMATNPFGSRTQSVIAFVIICVFVLLCLTRMPYRQRSSNVLFAFTWTTLGILSGFSVTLACSEETPVLLHADNMRVILPLLHSILLFVWVLTIFVGIFRTLLPSSSNALLVPADDDTEEDSQLTNNTESTELRSGRRKSRWTEKRKLFTHHAQNMLRNIMSKDAPKNMQLKRSSSCLGFVDEDDSDGVYPNFLDSPWPISFYEGRYFIRTFPDVLLSLKLAQHTIDRYLFADKTLVPLSTLDAAHADLQHHLVNFLSLPDNEKNPLLKKKKHVEAHPLDPAANSDELEQALVSAKKKLADLFGEEDPSEQADEDDSGAEHSENNSDKDQAEASELDDDMDAIIGADDPRSNFEANFVDDWDAEGEKRRVHRLVHAVQEQQALHHRRANQATPPFDVFEEKDPLAALLAKRPGEKHQEQAAGFDLAATPQSAQTLLEAALEALENEGSVRKKRATALAQRLLDVLGVSPNAQQFRDHRSADAETFRYSHDTLVESKLVAREGDPTAPVVKENHAHVDTAEDKGSDEGERQRRRHAVDEIQSLLQIDFDVPTLASTVELKKMWIEFEEQGDPQARFADAPSRGSQAEAAEKENTESQDGAGVERAHVQPEDAETGGDHEKNLPRSGSSPTEDKKETIQKRKKRRRRKSDPDAFPYLPEDSRRALMEFYVRRLSTLSHLSQRFSAVPIKKLFQEMHHRQSLTHAFRWILLEAFEILASLRKEVAQVTCLPKALPNGGDALMALLAKRCRQRDKDLIFMPAKKRRIHTKLIAIQFLCGKQLAPKDRTDEIVSQMLRGFTSFFE